jgi:hypothetical protein
MAPTQKPEEPNKGQSSDIRCSRDSNRAALSRPKGSRGKARGRDPEKGSVRDTTQGRARGPQEEYALTGTMRPGPLL